MTTNRIAIIALLIASGLIAACSEKPAATPPAPATKPAAAPAAPYAGGTSATTTTMAPPAEPADREKLDALKQIVSNDAAPAAPAAGAPPVAGQDAKAPVGALPTAGGPLTVADLRFTPPESWRFVHPNSAMRRAQYEIPGTAGAGEAVVYFFGAGQGGGVEANVERWLAQITPEPGAAAEAKPRESRTVNGVKVTTVRARGTYNAGMAMGGQEAKSLAGQAMVGVILESAGGPVFLKITGPAATIDASAKGIDALVDSIALVH